MKKSQFLAVMVSILFTASLLAVPIQAQVQVQTTREQLRAERCSRVTTLVDNRTKIFNSNKDRHITRFQGVVSRVQETITKLEAKQLDVTKLKADLQTLNQKIVEFGQSHAKFIQLLEDSKQYVCGASEGQFKTAMEAARAELKKSRALAKETITFIREELKKTVQELRQQIVDVKKQTI